jgi:tetratricopeptide (TPR) repeat protein
MDERQSERLLVIRKRIQVAGILVMVTLVSLFGQEDPYAEGRAKYADKKWNEAIDLFSRVAKENNRNGQAWLWLGLSYYQTGKYEVAMANLLKAEKLKTFPAFTKFSLARCFARMNEVQESFFWLEQAAKEGFGNLAQLENDEAFVKMRPMLQMDEIRRHVQRNKTPAEFDRRFRQMDFWIGEWDVYDQAGVKVGTNTISKQLGGASLVEHWTNANGIEGASINYYDPGSGKFKQQWVSQSGYNTSYEGEMINGSMVMIGINADINGIVTKNRMTFTPNADGTVTQFIETFNDSTDVWAQSFLGTYKRKKMD